MTIDEYNELTQKNLTHDEKEELYYYAENFVLDYNENAGYEDED